MRKLLLAVLGITVLIVACENKSPIGPEGPGGVKVTQTTTSTTTTTTSTPTTTTSTTSTTTTVPGGTSRRYTAFQPPPNIPADMTLFFELIFNGATPVSQLLSGRAMFGPKAIESEYRVTGVYIMGNGTTGDVIGELGDAPNPLESGGNFEGRLTAKMPGCTAERVFEGGLGQTLNWTGGQTVRDCAGSPLSFNGITMLRTDTGAPLPTTTSTSTVASTTTTSIAPTTTTTSAPTTTTTSAPTTTTSTTTTTTTTTACSYSVFPTTIAVPSTGTPAGSLQQFQVTTGAGCGWTATQQANTPWITNLAPLQGNGTQVVGFRASCYEDDSAPNVSRTATITVNGAVVTVTQQAGVRGSCSVSIAARARSGVGQF